MTSLLAIENEPTHLHESTARPPDTTTVRSAGPPFWDLIDRSDSALLDFDTEALEHGIEQARALLARHPTTYRNHLTIAKFIEGWIARIGHDAKPCKFNEGFIEALLEMIDHLRDGDFAAEPGDEVTHDGSSLATDIASTNGDRCARGHVHHRRRTVLQPTELSRSVTVIRPRPTAAPSPVDRASTS